MERAFVQWLQETDRASWTPVFLSLRTELLSWADLDDLVAIFGKVAPGDKAKPDDVDALLSMFQSLSVVEESKD